MELLNLCAIATDELHQFNPSTLTELACEHCICNKCCKYLPYDAYKISVFCRFCGKASNFTTAIIKRDAFKAILEKYNKKFDKIKGNLIDNVNLQAKCELNKLSNILKK